MEYCTLAELKTYLNISNGDSDSNLTQLITTLTGIIDIELGWNLGTQTINRRISGNGSNRLILEGSINTVNHVYLYSSYIGNEYIQVDVDFVDGSIVYLTTNIPKGNKNVQISYTRGFSAVPDEFKRFFLYYCKEMIAFEKGSQKVSSKKIEGLSVNYFSPSELAEITKNKSFMDMSAILKKYKNFTFGF